VLNSISRGAEKPIEVEETNQPADSHRADSLCLWMRFGSQLYMPTQPPIHSTLSTSDEWKGQLLLDQGVCRSIPLRSGIQAEGPAPTQRDSCVIHASCCLSGVLMGFGLQSIHFVGTSNGEHRSLFTRADRKVLSRGSWWQLQFTSACAWAVHQVNLA